MEILKADGVGLSLSWQSGHVVAKVKGGSKLKVLLVNSRYRQKAGLIAIAQATSTVGVLRVTEAAGGECRRETNMVSMVLNLTCYALKFVGSTTQRQDLLTASARFAAARSTMRLFDDAAAIKLALSYGLGKQDGIIWGTISIAGSAFTLGYLQAEKLGWLIDTGVLKVSKETEFWIKTYHKLFWSLYAFVGFVKSIRALHAAAKNVKSPNSAKCAPARFTLASLTTTKLLLDTVHAVSWLPPGWLWGSALSTQKASGIATVAAIMGLVIHFQAKRLLPR